MNDLGPLDTGYELYADGAANMGSGWVPLGSSGDPFTGTFDGQGFTITGLNLNRAGGYNGLFGSTLDASISDVVLSTVNITETSSGNYTGGLIGYAFNTSVENVSVDGSINAQSSYVGGLIGYLEDTDTAALSVITNSSADVNIDTIGYATGGLIGSAIGSGIVIHDVHALGGIETTVANAGGLIGVANFVKIYNAYATGSVTGTGGINSHRIGGLIGDVEKALIFDSYATGDVSGDSRIGGLIGDNWYGIIANVFSKGVVTGTGNDIGALIGESDIAEDYSLTGSFWNSETNGGPAIGDENGFIAISGLTTEQFTEAATFTEMGWDFNNVWVMGSEHPELRDTITYFAGEGTEGSPYLLGSSCAQLGNARFFPHNHYRVSQDMNCSETADWHGGAGFMGIAYPYDDYKFTGSFDGNEKTISGIVMNQELQDYIGFFRHIDTGGSVFDLTLDNIEVIGDDRVGGLTAALAGTATNVHVNGLVRGDYQIGGMVGIHAEGYGISNSSPLVYTWDGDSYEYIADVGEMINRGTDGEDFAVIDADKIAPKGDVYSVNISQEYNEIVYYDKVSLMLFDHAPGYTVVEPLLRKVNYDSLTTVSDTPSHPLRACADMYGNDCSDALKNYDDKWSYHDKSHVNEWVMDFGDLSNAERIQLVLRAARDYEATPDYDHRTISVMGPDGKWVQIYGRKELGSDGTPRLRTIDLTGKFLTNDYRVKFGFDRLRVNYIAIDTSAEVPFTMQEIAPSKVDLSFRGYTAMDKTYFNDHKYDEVSGVPPESFARQIGNFTRYGEVRPLLVNAEDHFVVMRHGDHMAIEFPYTGTVANGLERSYVLFNDVVYKHANEETGQTVNPLPFQGMNSYPDNGYPMTSGNVEYLNTWNTRVYTGLIGKGSTIIESSADVDVIGGSNVGGFVGQNEKLITRSYATGYVYASSQYAGGLVGFNINFGEITQSYSDNEFPENESIIGIGQAPVESACSAGGLTGLNDYVTISNSFSRSNVYATDCSVGAFSADTTLSSIINSYATGLATTDIGPNLGAFIGSNNDATSTHSFWNRELNSTLESCGAELSGDCDSVGAISGKTTVELKDLDTFTTALEGDSWDFTTIWGINSTDNDGHPFFRWQGFTHNPVEEAPRSSSNSSGGSASCTNTLTTFCTPKQVATTPLVSSDAPALCPADQIINQNMRAGARNGKYHNYTKAIVKEVKILQAHMNRLGFASGPEDGILGKKTDGAIKRMQKYLGTYQDGMVGPVTRNLINQSCGSEGLKKS
jgi:hypothetical protein